MFQSAPGGEAGGKRRYYSPSQARMQFQSAPGGEAGGKATIVLAVGTGYVFQSAPGGEAGGKPAGSGNVLVVLVSIRPRR